MEPSGRVMVPNLPVTPGPALGVPVTGGQYAAQSPAHLDAVAVSGANQYSVRPSALVSTGTPPIVAVFTVTEAPVAAGTASRWRGWTGTRSGTDTGECRPTRPATPLRQPAAPVAASGQPGPAAACPYYLRSSP